MEAIERRVSLNITIEATDEQMANEAELRRLCMDKMRKIGTDPDRTSFEENVTIDPFEGCY